MSRRRTPDYLQPLSRDVAEAIRKVTAAHEPERERDPRRFRQVVIHAAVKAVPTAPPGRRGSPTVKTAARMQEQGKPWASIYKHVIPDFGGLSNEQRRQESAKLRARVRAAKSAKKLRKGQQSDRR